MAFRVSDLAESGGFLGGNRESGERSLSRHQTDYRLDKSNCDAKTRLPLPRRGATLPCVTGRRDCHSERDLADCERRSGIWCQALFRVDIQVVSI
jgi:hypothetical protein